MNRFKVIDGGLSTELIRQFKHAEILKDPLWSAKLVATHPGDIALAHESFLRAGADLLETCTYQASLHGFQKHLDVPPSKAAELYQKAINLCLKARDEFWLKSINKMQNEKPLVVGSIGPYGAYLANRSEYDGSYVDTITDELLKEWHRPQVQQVCLSDVDLMAFETLPAKKEAMAILGLLREFPYSKTWISFSCKDETHTSHGENITEVVEEMLSKHGGDSTLIGIGMNCSSPSIAGRLIEKIRSVLMEKGKHEDISVVCYPDGGGEWQSDGSWKNAQRQEIHVKEWISNGAQWIGGCCMTTPGDICLTRKIIDNHVKAE